MKKLCFVVIYVTTTLFCTAQTTTANKADSLKNGDAVTISNWGSLSIFIGANYFEETKAEIVKNIGEVAFNDMKGKCTPENWPSEIYDMSFDEEKEKISTEKRNKLNMYLLTTYVHKYNGKTFDIYAIVKVPYDRNKTWDEKVKWEGSIYFMLKLMDISKKNG